MTKATINHQIVDWAVKRSGYTIESIAKSLGVKTEAIERWSSGADLPTFKQAQNLAHCLSIAFGYLYLTKPPEETIPVADMRTLGDYDIGNMSLELKDCLADALDKQEWYKEYLIENDIAGPTFVGAIDCKNMDLSVAVDSIKFHLNGYDRPKTGNFENHFSLLVEKIEDAGVLVLRNSIVKSNTSRSLDVNEFRGFALVDKLAPLIFINTSDSPEARLFTLIHELVHVFVGQSAVSDSSPSNNNFVEKYCNKVAAEFLVPTGEFYERWRLLEGGPFNTRVETASKYFRVSRWVIARKLCELGLISQSDYWAYINEIYRVFRKNKTEKSSDSNVAFPVVQLSRVGKKLAKAVSSEALSGNLLLRDAHRLIGIRPANLRDFAKRELGL